MSLDLRYAATIQLWAQYVRKSSIVSPGGIIEILRAIGNISQTTVASKSTDQCTSNVLLFPYTYLRIEGNGLHNSGGNKNNIREMCM